MAPVLSVRNRFFHEEVLARFQHTGVKWLKDLEICLWDL